MRSTRFPALLLIAFILSSPLLAANTALKSEPVFATPETGNQIEVVKTYLSLRSEDGSGKIWVFFTDKAVFDQKQFDDLAASVTLTDRAWERRAKMGLDKVTFADLPVNEEYIEAVIGEGAELRRISRWLNAASFSVPLDKIDRIRDLWFVAKIRPVAAYHKVDPIPGEPLLDTFLKDEHPQYDLNYGISFGQLNQINVPAVHDKGHNGSGVIVAMFDTGYRKDHDAFAAAYSEGRVLAEWDFIFDDGNTQNEAEDVSSQHNHGTYTWSTLGGSVPGQLYGPAYGASFILAKTEDVRSETPVEEDNWMAAVEWADSIGAQVISSSLSYSDWYVYSDYDGSTAVTTIAANMATSYGIVVSNSMGNYGPAAGTLGAPADAPEILAIGAVNSSGTIASFSSRGPTADGRIKPEVCAQGVSTYCASPGAVNSYTYVGGTSLSCPLVGGCAAVLLSARPSLTPQQVRLALMHTANNADSPDNTYGWGIVNLAEALQWGANFTSDVAVGSVPMTVSFYDSSYVSATGWTWSFGDGDTAYTQNPVHTYDAPGFYDVSLTIISDGQPLTAEQSGYVIAIADTLTYVSDTVYAGRQAVIDVEVANNFDLQNLVIPVDFSSGMSLGLDSFSVAGTRADGFYDIIVGGSVAQKKMAILLQAISDPLPPGHGSVLRFYFNTDPYAFGNWSAPIDTVTMEDKGLKLSTASFDYVPVANGGQVVIRDVARGDANNDGLVNVGDAVFMINYIYSGGDAPITIESGDANSDFVMNAGDPVYLINYIFSGGPPPNDI